MGSNESVKTQADVDGYIDSTHLDRVAEYAGRGRAFKDLLDEQLLERWAEAYKEMAESPSNAEKEKLQDDLACELRLRGRAPPLERVYKHFQKYFSAIDAAYNNLKDNDPAGYAEANRRLEDDIEDFKSRRDTSKS